MPARDSFTLLVDGDEPSAEELANAIIKNQHTFWALGRYLTGSESFRGPPSDEVKNSCKLVISTIGMGNSIEAVVTTPVAKIQTSLGVEDGEEPVVVPESTLGNDAVRLFTEMEEVLATEDLETAHDRFHDMIEHPRHRLNIARKVQDSIDDSAPYKVITRDGTRIHMNRHIRRKATAIAKAESDELAEKGKVETVHGAITSASIVGARRMKLDNYECELSEADIPIIIDLFGKVVNLTGRVERLKDVKRFKVLEIIDIVEMESHTFSEIDFHGVVVHLKNSIEAKVSFEDDAIWIIHEGDVLRFIGSGETFQEAKESFEADVITALLGYAMEPDDNLTEGAIELRDALRDIVVDWEVVFHQLANL